MTHRTAVTHPAEEAARTALVDQVLAHLDARPHRWHHVDLAGLDATGWAIIAADMGRTRPFSDATTTAIVRAAHNRETFRNAGPADPFEGLV